MRLLSVLIAVAVLWSGAAQAGVIEVQKVADGVYALVGPMGNRDKANLGNNATFGLVVTDKGAVLVDPGGSHKGAAMVEAAVRTVTDQPIVAVINSGGQDHRWLGNGYFKAKGATIYASEASVADQKERYSQQAQGLEFLIGKDGLAGTKPVHADVTFADRHAFSLGGVDFDLIRGAAHTPGDTIVWVASHKTAFTGDLVYRERLLGIIDVSVLNDWLDSFVVLEGLNPDHVVPGHGHATTLDGARRHTRDYLLNLQTRIRAVVAEAKGDRAAVAVDQSPWASLGSFDQLAKRNALAAYFQLEFE